MTSKKKQELHLDPEEQALLDSFENGEWQSVKKLDAEKSKARQAAANYLRKGALKFPLQRTLENWEFKRS